MNLSSIYKANKFFRLFTYTIVFSLLYYGFYKLCREIFWVDHATAPLDENIQVDIRVDDEMIQFLDPIADKTITIRTKHTHRQYKVSFESLELDLAFYIDTFNGQKAIIIRNGMYAYNAYDYNTLQQLNKHNNFDEFGVSSGDDEKLPALKATPILVYDYTGLHK